MGIRMYIYGCEGGRHAPFALRWNSPIPHESRTYAWNTFSISRDGGKSPKRRTIKLRCRQRTICRYRTKVIEKSWMGSRAYALRSMSKILNQFQRVVVLGFHTLAGLSGGHCFVVDTRDYGVAWRDIFEMKCRNKNNLCSDWLFPTQFRAGWNLLAFASNDTIDLLALLPLLVLSATG